MSIPFGLMYEGELTKKQIESLKIVATVISAFYTAKYRKKPRTWKFLLRNVTKKLGKTKEQKKTLHRYLVELIGQGVLKGEVKAIGKHLETFYEYTEGLYYVKGEKRLTFKSGTKDVNGKTVSGFLKRGRSKSWYFVPVQDQSSSMEWSLKETERYNPSLLLKENDLHSSSFDTFLFQRLTNETERSKHIKRC